MSTWHLTLDEPNSLACGKLHPCRLRGHVYHSVQSGEWSTLHSNRRSPCDLLDGVETKAVPVRLTKSYTERCFNSLLPWRRHTLPATCYATANLLRYTEWTLS